MRRTARQLARPSATPHLDALPLTTPPTLKAMLAAVLHQARHLDWEIQVETIASIVPTAARIPRARTRCSPTLGSVFLTTNGVRVFPNGATEIAQHNMCTIVAYVWFLDALTRFFQSIVTTRVLKRPARRGVILVPGKSTVIAVTHHPPTYPADVSSLNQMALNQLLCTKGAQTQKE